MGTTLRDPKYDALKVRATGGGRTIKITVAALHQTSDRIGTVVRRTAKRVKRGQIPCRIDSKDGALKVLTAQCGRAVEIAIAGLHQPGNRNSTLA